MLAAVATFVLCAAIIVGSYWVFVVRPEQREGRALRRRLSAESVERAPRTELTKNTPPLSALKVLDTLLAHSDYLVAPLQRLIALGALPVTVGMVLLACGLAATVTFVAIALISGVWLAVLLALLAALGPYWYLRRAARKRVRKIEEQFPQAVDLIAASLRAGHAFTTGLLMVAEEIADPLGAEFRAMYDQQNYGKPLTDVLKEFAERVPLLDVRIFVTAVLTQRETGGNLAEVLDKLSALVRERFKVRRQVQVVSAHGRTTGWVLIALPPAVAGLLFLIAPTHIRTLVDDPLGLRLTLGAVFLQIAGTFAIRRIVSIEL
jgi:tight adherence protein B